MIAAFVVSTSTAMSTAAAEDAACEDEDCIVLRGRVARAGDRVLLPRVPIIVAAPGEPPAWILRVATDDEGRFSVDIPQGRVRIVILVPGFERFETTVNADVQSKPLAIALRPDSSDPYRTVVAARPRPDVGVSPRRLDREEVATAPGTQGDALRALQSLPGIARTPGGLGLLVLRGASPRQSVLFVGEHRVPRAFHALAISSVVPADALEEVEFVPSNYSSRYGNGTGGAVILHPRPGRRDGWHGYGELDLAGVGGMVEGPVGRGSILAAVQRSYVDAYLRAAESLLSHAFVLPAAWDYQLWFDHPVGRRTTISTRVLGSEDRVRNRYIEEGEILTGSELRAGFHRADLELRTRSGPWRFLLTPSFRFEYQRFEPQDFVPSRRRDYVTSGRAEAEVRLSRRAGLTLGADVEIDAYAVETSLIEDGEEVPERGDGLATSTGLYAVSDVRIGPWLLVPGVRVNAFTHVDDAEIRVDPRLLSRVDLSSQWVWTAGVGLYSQPETDAQLQSTEFLDETLGGPSARWLYPSAVDDLSPVVALLPASEEVRVAQALQTSTAVAYMPSDALVLEVGGYLRHRDESLSTASNADGTTERTFPPRTRNYGMEVLLRRRNVRRLYGWISYTLSWARSDSLEPPTRTQIDPFDQRHNLAVVASYALPRHWRIGGRFRLVSGSPYTPILGAADNPTSGGFVDTTAVPLYGDANSARFPVFHQLDLRVDKRWYARKLIATLYLDVQNVYNQPNVELYRYTADFRRREATLGLPIFPSIGVRIDF
jgi:hypothetical protein